MVKHLFGDVEYRFGEDTFPFTEPSFEIEVFSRSKNKLIEILGCGVVINEILISNGIIDQKAIACGLGLDRLAMLFADIPDIRYLWVTHERFLSQFNNGLLNKFQPYSVLPNQSRSISFYVSDNTVSNDKWLQENDMFELVRDSDEVEKVELL